MRHVLIFAIVHAILMCCIPRMERVVLERAVRMFPILSRAQNILGLPDNMVRASFLAIVWPFAVLAGPVVFVELGCFSMMCFALAARLRPDGVLRFRRKQSWRRLLRHHGIRTPTILAHIDKKGRVIADTPMIDAKICGVRKPERGMYGRGVRLESVADFLERRGRDEALEAEVVDVDGVRGRSFRVCTLNTRFGVRLIAIFTMTLRTSASIPIEHWRRLRDIGASLARVHGASLPWAPLVGWDVMIDAQGCVVLEGNLGGSVSMQFMSRQLGVVDATNARQWIEAVRDAHRHGLYRRASRVHGGRHCFDT